MAKIVTLTWSEMLIACIVGIMRYVSNLCKGKVEMYGCDPERGWDAHINGAMGEAAVAKYYNAWWSGNVGNLLAADVGKLQVRTRMKPCHKLCLHPRDKDEENFILVTVAPPRFTLEGFIQAKDGKRQEYWGDPASKNRPAFWVPANHLRPIEELKAAA